MVKNLPAMQETWVRSLGWEDPLKKEMATHSGILAWEIPWTEEPGRLQSMRLQRVGHDQKIFHSVKYLIICSSLFQGIRESAVKGNHIIFFSDIL